MSIIIARYVPDEAHKALCALARERCQRKAVPVDPKGAADAVIARPAEPPEPERAGLMRRLSPTGSGK